MFCFVRSVSYTTVWKRALIECFLCCETLQRTEKCQAGDIMHDIKQVIVENRSQKEID